MALHLPPPSGRPLPTPAASQGPLTRVSSGLPGARWGTGPLLTANSFEGCCTAVSEQKAWAGLGP